MRDSASSAVHCTLSSLRRFRLHYPVVLRLVFLPFIALGILTDRSPVKTSLVAPGVEHNTLRKRLSFGGNHHAIVLGKSSGKGFSPVEVECFELQCIQLMHQIFCPLITEAPLPDAGVDEDIVKSRREDYSIFASQSSRCHVGTLGEPLGFIYADTRREHRKLGAQLCLRDPVATPP